MKKTRSTPKAAPARRSTAKPARPVIKRAEKLSRSVSLAAGPAPQPRAVKKSRGNPSTPRPDRKSLRAVVGQAAKLAAGPAQPPKRKSVPPPLLPADLRLLQLLEKACEVIEDKKGYGLKRFDLRSLNAFTDFLLIATGDATTQNRAIADGIEERLRVEFGVRPLGIEGAQAGEWVLVDYGGLVVNLFTPATREHYSLERLWADATLLPAK